MANVTGWGRGAWDDGPWGEANPVVVTGVEGTGAVTTVTISADANVTVTGVSATGSIGSVTIIEGSGVTVSITSVAGTGAVGWLRS